MKIWAWAAAVGSVAAFVACGDTETGNTGGAGGNAASSSSSTTVSVSSSSGNPSTSSSGTGGTTGCGSFLYSTDTTCQTCAETSCCAELQACDTGTACNDLFTCLDGCNDQACQDMCIQQNQGGLSDAQGLITCVTGPQGGTGACNTECAAAGICGTQLTYNDNVCDACLTMQCCASFDACTADPACNDCLTGAGMNCDQNALFTAFQMCRTGTCGDSCGAQICTSDWSIKPKACADCLGANCCANFTACTSGSKCADCLTGATTAGCDTDPNYKAIDTCFSTTCSAQCGG